MDQVYPVANVYTTPQGYYYTQPPPPLSYLESRPPLPPLTQKPNYSSALRSTFFKSKLFFGLLIAVSVLIGLGIIVAVVLIALYATSKI